MLVLKADVHRPEEHIVREAVQLVRDRIGPVASFKTAVIVGRLPKTRSGKILRGTMRRIANDHQYSVPPTIDDPKILEEITEALTSSRLRPRLRECRAEQLKLRRFPCLDGIEHCHPVGHDELRITGERMMLHSARSLWPAALSLRPGIYRSSRNFGPRFISFWRQPGFRGQGFE